MARRRGLFRPPAKETVHGRNSELGLVATEQSHSRETDDDHSEPARGLLGHVAEVPRFVRKNLRTGRGTFHDKIQSGMPSRDAESQ